MFYWNEFIREINKAALSSKFVFDAGAGDCHWRKYLVNNIKYVSMDLGVGDGNADYSNLDIIGDLSSIPLDDDSVDIIICIQVLEHVPKPWIVLQEFFRILKKGGVIFLTCPQGEPMHQVPYDFYRYTRFGLQELFTSSGFDVEWIRPQKGSFHKIATDLRKEAILLRENRKTLSAIVLKFIARMIDLLFGRLDAQFTNNTTGYFIKAWKE